MNGFGYTSMNNYLDIQFTSSSADRHGDVSSFTFERLQHAPPQGGYFNERIRDFYSHERLE